MLSKRRRALSGSGVWGSREAETTSFKNVSYLTCDAGYRLSIGVREYPEGAARPPEPATKEAQLSTFLSVAGAVGVAILLVSVSLAAFLVVGAIFGAGVGIYKLREALT